MSLCRGSTIRRSIHIFQTLPVSGYRSAHGQPPVSVNSTAWQSSCSAVIRHREDSVVKTLIQQPVPFSSTCKTSNLFSSSLADPHFNASKLSPSSISEYVCPTRVVEQLSKLVILDAPLTRNETYKCPVSHPVVDTIAPDTLTKSEVSEPDVGKPPAKEAKMIMRIRHKKMKKHKLKKLRKRMYFLWRKQKQARKAKRLGIYNRELEEIKQKGEQFDAEEFVRSQLAKARRGGYYINVFESKV